jgi:hypothetical protein
MTELELILLPLHRRDLTSLMQFSPISRSFSPRTRG